MIDNELIRGLLNLNNYSNKKLVLNDKFTCEFVVPDSITDKETYFFFSEFAKDCNCPMMSCYADVNIVDEATNEKHNGKVYINHNLDIGNDGQYSLMLHITDSDNKTMFTVVKCIVEDLMDKVQYN